MNMHSYGTLDKDDETMNCVKDYNTIKFEIRKVISSYEMKLHNLIAQCRAPEELHTLIRINKKTYVSADEWGKISLLKRTPNYTLTKISFVVLQIITIWLSTGFKHLGFDFPWIASEAIALGVTFVCLCIDFGSKNYSHSQDDSFWSWTIYKKKGEIDKFYKPHEQLEIYEQVIEVIKHRIEEHYSKEVSKYQKELDMLQGYKSLEDI